MLKIDHWACWGCGTKFPTAQATMEHQNSSPACSDKGFSPRFKGRGPKGPDQCDLISSTTGYLDGDDGDVVVKKK